MPASFSAMSRRVALALSLVLKLAKILDFGGIVESLINACDGDTGGNGFYGSFRVSPAYLLSDSGG